MPVTDIATGAVDEHRGVAQAATTASLGSAHGGSFLGAGG